MVKKPTQTTHAENWDEWEEWGENFGRRMEKAFSSPKRIGRKVSIAGLLFGLFLLSWGLVWLGNDIGYWQIPFPFWPVLIILLSLGILLSVIKGFFGHR